MYLPTAQMSGFNLPSCVGPLEEKAATLLLPINFFVLEPTPIESKNFWSFREAPTETPFLFVAGEPTEFGPWAPLFPQAKNMRESGKFHINTSTNLSNNKNSYSYEK
jgi:hypothetical protein